MGFLPFAVHRWTGGNLILIVLRILLWLIRCLIDTNQRGNKLTACRINPLICCSRRHLLSSGIKSSREHKLCGIVVRHSCNVPCSQYPSCLDNLLDAHYRGQRSRCWSLATTRVPLRPCRDTSRRYSQAAIRSLVGCQSQLPQLNLTWCWLEACPSLLVTGDYSLLRRWE